MKKILPILLAFILLTSLNSCEKKSKYKIFVQFPEGDNLKIGADVKSRDVAIGSVASVDLYGSTGVLVGLEIDPKYKVPKDSKVKLHVENLLIGEKYIDIAFSESAEFWDNNDTLKGAPSGMLDFNLEDLGLDGLQGLEGLNDLIESIDVSQIEEHLNNLNLEEFEEQINNLNLDDLQEQLNNLNLDDSITDQLQRLKSEFEKLSPSELNRMTPDELKEWHKQVIENSKSEK